MSDVMSELRSRPYSWADLPQMSASGFHGSGGEIEWRFDPSGLYTRRPGATEGPLRTPGEPRTVLEALRLHGDAIHAFSLRYRIPAELILMTIGAESAAARPDGFTGPRTFRWEAHVPVGDVSPPERGDYSAGPMQTLATTARWVAGRQAAVGYEPFAAAPHLPDRPPIPPVRMPLYNPVLSIDLGCAVIIERWRHSADDPILVAACYNAGGLYASDGNRWGLRSYGNHLDRAAAFYGDACAVLEELRGSGRRSLVALGGVPDLAGAPMAAAAMREVELRPALPFTTEQLLGTEGDEGGIAPDGAAAELEAAEAEKDTPEGERLDRMRLALPPAAVAGGADNYLDRFSRFIDDLGLRHFAASEFLFMGGKNAPGGSCAGLNALPDDALWPRLAATAKMIDEIRNRHGSPITILSGYRSPDYNRCVRGEATSLHLSFNALDFTSRSGTPADWAAIAAEVRREDRNRASRQYSGGIGVYLSRNFVHIDTRGRDVDWIR